MKSLKEIASRFNIEGEVEAIEPLGEGLINDTYLLTTTDGNPDYVLQCINHHVFRNVEGMQRNIEIVTDHIRKKLHEAGEKDIERRVLEFVTVKDGDATFSFDGADYWRMSHYIDESKTINEVTPETAYAAGRAFGQFQKMLSDVNAELVESIPDFHNIEFRLSQLKEAVENDKVDRRAAVEGILEEIWRREKKMCEPERMYREGHLPKRICHCDTKVNNMLFDKDGDVMCVIDLDTVMPSFIFSDYGDFLRTGACTSAEDEPDLEKIGFNMSIFKSFTDGYFSEARSFLTEDEIRWLPNSVALFPYMQAVRFLTDYLNGDTYYKISYPEHNLVRTKAQMKLLSEIEHLMPEIKEYVLSH